MRRSVAGPQNQTSSKTLTTVLSERQKIRRLELVSELFDICNSTSNLSELMNKVFKEVMTAVGAEAGSLWLIDEQRTELTCHVAEGPTRDKVVGMKLPSGTGVVGFVIDTGDCQTVFDTTQDPRFANSVDQKTGFKTRSMICAPLIIENSAIGAVQLLNKSGGDGKFDTDDLQLLRMLCQSSSTPIVNARLRTSEQKVQELSILLDISKEITSTLDLDSCMLSTTNLCSKLIPYDRAVIALESKGVLKISAVSGMATIDQFATDIVNIKALLEGIYKKSEDVYIPSGKKYLKSESRVPYIEEYVKKYHTGTLAVYYLCDSESQLGLFMMESKKENLITGSQSERIAILKNMLTVALRNAQLYNSVPTLSVLGRLRHAKFSKKKALFGLIGAACALALLFFVKTTFFVKGTCEIAPQQKYMLYSKLDNALVENVMADNEGKVSKGDTLIVFDTEDLVNRLTKEENNRAVLEQTISILKQQQKYSDYHLKSLELEKTHIEIASLKRNIKESVLISPVDGKLINGDISNFTGRRFGLGSPVVEIVETGNMGVKVLVPQRYINLVKTGQECLFRVPAYPDKTFKGKIAQITCEVDNKGETAFAVMVRVAPGVQLFPGMTGRAKIRTGRRSLLNRLIEKPQDFISSKLWL